MLCPAFDGFCGRSRLLDTPEQLRFLALPDLPHLATLCIEDVAPIFANAQLAYFALNCFRSTGP
jgi:hypothetical protein